MRLLYLTQWFEPEPAFKGADFAERLAAAGHDVEIATGFPNYPGGKVYDGYRVRPYRADRTAGGLRVHRLALYPSHDRSSAGRALNYFSFFLSCLAFGLVRGWRYDAVYVYHPPITPALAMALIARLCRFRLVLDIQDLWPDSAAASGMASPRLVAVLERLCQFVYRRADRIVVQSDGMQSQLAGRGVPQDKLVRIYNWSTYRAGGEPLPVSVEQSFSSSINVVYGGNLGQAQALEHVVAAIEIARASAPELRLHLFGNGIDRNMLEQLAATNPEAALLVHQAVDRSTMDRIFDAADILVLHLKQDPLYEFTIPSKSQHYLACGKPVVAGVSGEVAEILRASGSAMVCAPEDSTAMAACFVKLARMGRDERSIAGAKGRRFYEEQFSVESAIRRTLDVLCSTATTGSPTARDSRI